MNIVMAGENIKVALTATKFISNSTGPSSNLFLMNAPVCVAIQTMGMAGKGIEQVEHIIAETCKADAKEVIVNSEKKTIYIGSNSEEERTGLVEYTELGNSDYVQEFFRRWNETKSMIFDFQARDTKKLLFCLRGIWQNNRWAQLEIMPTPLVTIM